MPCLPYIETLVGVGVIGDPTSVSHPVCESSNSDTALQTGKANSYMEGSVLPPGRKGSGGTDVPAVGWLVLQMVPNQGMMSLAGRLGVQQWW